MNYKRWIALAIIILVLASIGFVFTKGYLKNKETKAVESFIKTSSFQKPSDKCLAVANKDVGQADHKA